MNLKELLRKNCKAWISIFSCYFLLVITAFTTFFLDSTKFQMLYLLTLFIAWLLSLMLIYFNFLTYRTNIHDFNFEDMTNHSKKRFFLTHALYFAFTQLSLIVLTIASYLIVSIFFKDLAFDPLVVKDFFRLVGELFYSIEGTITILLSEGFIMLALLVFPLIKNKYKNIYSIVAPAILICLIGIIGLTANLHLSLFIIYCILPFITYIVVTYIFYQRIK